MGVGDGVEVERDGGWGMGDGVEVERDGGWGRGGTGWGMGDGVEVERRVGRRGGGLFGFEWGVYAQSASEAIFRASTEIGKNGGEVGWRGKGNGRGRG